MQNRRTNQQFEISLLETMLEIRRFEEAAIKAYGDLLIPGVLHSSIGQEAIAAGVCANLGQDDYIISNHRGHGHCLAKGIRPGALMAEVFGKSTGCCRGLGGSMHITDPAKGVLLSTGIVGSGIPISLGAGLSIQLRKTDQIVACFFGDGASNTGSFHESLNLASLWKLPIVFVCENNQYALSQNVRRSTSVERISARAASYSIPGYTVDGNDVMSVYDAMKKARNRASQMNGPTLLEFMTYRWFGHHMLDPTTDYRDTTEIEEWKKRCPIENFKNRLFSQGLLTDVQFREMDKRVQEEINSATRFAKESANPTPDIISMLVHVAEPTNYIEPGGPSRDLTFCEALRDALREEMLRDERVILLGEDIGRFGGIFRVTKGLFDEFGPQRVKDTPISEAAILGTALGAAMTGFRPVAEIMYMDFLNVCMDQLVNHIAKVHFMTGGQVKAPLVIRTQSSLDRFMGAQHSQLFPSWFLSVPGLKVAVPSDPSDAKGLLKTAIRGENPVLFIEMGKLYARKGKVPDGDYTIPFGKAAVKREGKHVTVVALLDMVHKALSAANEAAREGIDVEVIDPRTIVPLDEECIIGSVRKTRKLVIAEEGPKKGGVGAEIAALVSNEAFDDLDSPIQRVGAMDSPVPFSPALQDRYIPSQNDILEAVRVAVL